MAKKKYMVVPRTTEAQQKGVTLGNDHYEFKENGRGTNHFWVDDPVIAQEIDQASGLKGSKQVWVHEDPGYEFHLKHDGSDGHMKEIHFYTFGPTSAYAKAWEEFEGRRKDKKGRTKKEGYKTMKDEELTDLYFEADNKTKELLDFIFSLKKVITQKDNLIKNLESEYEDAFNDFLFQKEEADKAYKTALKMYENPQNAKAIFLEKYGEP